MKIRIRYRILLHGPHEVEDEDCDGQYFQYDTDKFPPMIIPGMLVVLGCPSDNIPWLVVTDDVREICWKENEGAMIVEVSLEEGHIGTDRVISAEYIQAMKKLGWYYQ